MNVGSNRDVTELLRSLPDMRPPEGAWRRIVASRARRYPLAWSGAALAACAALVAVFLLVREDPPAAPVEMYLVDAGPAAAAMSSVERATVQADVGTLRRQSRQMERLLSGLPQRSTPARTDMTGAIADLQRRIAAVDYELNRVDLGGSVRAPSALRRWPTEPTAADWPDGRQVGVAAPQASDLWQHRVDLMNRLVRARFVEAGAEAH